MWMTFFLHKGHASRTEPLDSYDEAIEAARRGPSGAMFFVTHLAKDPNDAVQVLEGYVP